MINWKNINTPKYLFNLANSVGSNVISNGGQILPIARLRVHHEFSEENFDNDFAVIELAENIVFDATKAPADLPNESEFTERDVTVTVAGFGETFNLNEGSKRILQSTKLITMNQPNCIDDMSQHGFAEITSNMICAKAPDASETNFCFNDNGGGMVDQTNKIVGVISFGLDCSGSVPGVYGRVSSARAWINSVTGL